MMGIGACAFAVDALYAAVKDHLPLRPDLEAAWKKNSTARHRRIVETLKRGFAIKPQGAVEVGAFLKHPFELRNWAVHPPADFRQPIQHPDIDAGVEWRFLAFSADNLRKAVDTTSTLFRQLLEPTRRTAPELSEWVESARARLNHALAHSSAEAKANQQV